MVNLSVSFRRIASFFRLLRGIVLMTLMAMLLLALAGWCFLPRWLPKIAQRWLPADVRLSIAPRSGGWKSVWRLPDLALNRGDCVWIKASQLSVKRSAGLWRLDARRIDVDLACRPVSQRAKLRWDQLSAVLPAISVHIEQLTVAPWRNYAGEVQLTPQTNGIQLTYRNPRIMADLRLQDRQLIINQLILPGLSVRQPV